MHIRCWDELVRYGAMDILKREYGSLVQAQPESEYNISLLIDLETAPPEGGGCLFCFRLFKLLTIDNEEQRDTFIHSIALLKRNALAAPFELAFKKQKELESSSTGQGDLMAIHYRDEEAIYIRAAHDRVTVIFSTVFREETDRIFGKVFLQVCLIHHS